MKMIKCKVENCGNKYLAKGYCKSHYYLLKRNKTLERKYYINKNKICKIVDCNKSAISKLLCSIHYERYRKYGVYEHTKENIEILKKKARNRMLKEKNPRWNNGIFEYPNHYEMKKNRLIKLQQTHRKCEICGKVANYIHHKDGSKNNHSLNNLIVICIKCHFILHNEDYKAFKYTSKMIRLYGISFREMAEKYGSSIARFYNMHREGILKNYLKTIDKRKIF